MNNYLRKQCKMLKVMQNIAYKELAEYLEIKSNSFYLWLNGYYDFGAEKQERLKEILADISEQEE